MYAINLIKINTVRNCQNVFPGLLALDFISHRNYLTLQTCNVIIELLLNHHKTDLTVIIYKRRFKGLISNKFKSGKKQ